MDIMLKSACLVVNPNMGYGYAFLYNVQASRPNEGSDVKLSSVG